MANLAHMLQQFLGLSGAQATALAGAISEVRSTADTEQTTVGSAGGADALPATPTKYIQVIDSEGATLVVPAYDAE